MEAHHKDQVIELQRHMDDARWYVFAGILGKTHGLCCSMVWGMKPTMNILNLLVLRGQMRLSGRPASHAMPSCRLRAGVSTFVLTTTR